MAILDLNVKMISEHGKNLPIRSGLPNSIEKVILRFLGFQMALAAILDFEGHDYPISIFVQSVSKDITFSGFQYGPPF